jgi:hypothetical protein
MKKLLSIIFIFLSLTLSNELLAASFTNGYIIMDGDTIQCKIKIQETIFGLDEFRLQSEVTTKDSTDKQTKYTPGQIQGFGFTFNKEPVNYVSKVVDNGKTALFIKVVTLGKRLNLFKYEMRGNYMRVGTPNSFGPTKTTTVTIFYVLMDDTKREVVLNNGLFAGNGKRIKEYFRDQPDLLQLYEQKVTSFQLIPEFVSAANTL